MASSSSLKGRFMTIKSTVVTGLALRRFVLGPSLTVSPPSPSSPFRLLSWGENGRKWESFLPLRVLPWSQSMRGNDWLTIVSSSESSTKRTRNATTDNQGRRWELVPWDRQRRSNDFRTNHCWLARRRRWWLSSPAMRRNQESDTWGHRRRDTGIAECRDSGCRLLPRATPPSLRPHFLRPWCKPLW